MDIGEVLSRSWQIIRKHKVLWVFGILASLSGGFHMTYSGGGSSSNEFNVELPMTVERYINTTPQWEIFLIAAVLIILAILIGILFYVLATIGKIGVTNGAMQFDEGAEKLSFGDLFKSSMHYFWRIFLLDILIGLVLFFLIIAFGIVFVTSTLITFGLMLCCLIPLICLLIPVGFAIGVWLRLSMIAIVVEDIGIFEGLKRGWKVLKENVGSITLMWLILDLAIRILIGFIIAVPMMFLMFAIFTGIFSESLRFLLWLGIAGFVVFLPVLIVLYGILYTYVTTGWTLTFLRLTKGPKLPVGIPSGAPAPDKPDEPLTPSTAEKQSIEETAKEETDGESASGDAPETREKPADEKTSSDEEQPDDEEPIPDAI